MQQSDYEIVGKFGFESRTHRQNSFNSKDWSCFLFILFLPYHRAIRTKHIHTQSCTLASRKTDIKTPAKKTAQAQSLFCPRFRGGFQTGFLRAKN